MLSSLKARLWLSYAALIGLALSIVALGMFWSLLRSPLLYRQAVLRLRLAGAALAPQVNTLLDGPRSALEQFIRSEANERQIRLMLFRSSGEILVDTGGTTLARLPQAPLLSENLDLIRSFTLRDIEGRAWLYIVQPLTQPYHLLVAILRPALPLRTILRDEVVSPLVWAGMAALVLAFGLSLLVSGWIANPLQRIAAQASSLTGENFTPLPLEGPTEVRQLARSFNEMVTRVQDGQRSQRDFIANVSHELKTPLTSIQGFSQAILEGAVEQPEELRQAARVIYEEAGRMNRLVADLLALARLEAGTAELQQTAVDLNALLAGVKDKFVLQSQSARIHLSIGLNDSPTVLGDSDRLTQVFSNLVDNAIRFTPPGGKVTLFSEVIRGCALVKVTDTGIGIELGEQRRIFDRFYQVDSSRRGGENRGAGLGLAIARQIVLAHQGKIWVESTPGKGTTFFIQLPLLLDDQKPLETKKS